MKVYSGGPLEVPAITLAQHFHQKASANAGRVGFRARPAKGQPYQEWTWAQVQQAANEIGNALLSTGLNVGDRVALVSETRMEWSLADYGILTAGGTVVTVYPTLTDEQVAYLLKDSQSSVVFAEDQKQLDKIAKAIATNPQVKRIVTFVDATVPASIAKMTTTLAAFRSEGKQYGEANVGKLEQRLTAGKPDDVCTLVYTSGTTGVPKGAILTHRNFISATLAAQKVLQVPENGKTLVFLPLAHCYGRLQLQHAVHITGAISFGSPSTLVDDLKETRPVYLASVPRLYERMYAQIVKKVEEGTDERKKKIFHKAAQTAREYGRAISNGGTPGFGLKIKHALFDRLVYHKLREALGLTHLKIGITGSAAIRPDLLYFFQGIGVPIFEGYGLTETSAPSNVNLPSKFKPGTVGPPFPGMEMTLADDGEVLMKGPNVFKGYYNLAGETKDAFNAEGWFQTGDIGTFDEDGFLKIVDRKKEIEVLNTGKKISVTVKEKLKLNPLVADACLVATDRKFAGCLIQPNFDILVDWANKNGVSYDKSKVIVKPDPTGQPMTYQVGMDLLENPQTRGVFQKAIDETNVKCADFEQIRTFTLADHAFTMDRDELTPTLKKKRRVILAHYKERVDAMFK